jgi:hypothetical protein
MFALILDGSKVILKKIAKIHPVKSSIKCRPIKGIYFFSKATLFNRYLRLQGFGSYSALVILKN